MCLAMIFNLVLNEHHFKQEKKKKRNKIRKAPIVEYDIIHCENINIGAMS